MSNGYEDLTFLNTLIEEKKDYSKNDPNNLLSDTLKKVGISFKRKVYEKEVVDDRARRYNIPVDKGISLTKEHVDETFDFCQQYLNLWSLYPDLLLDLIRPYNSTFNLAFYQRIFLRVLARFQIVYVTAPRGFSKSLSTILGMYLLCIFRPGIKVFLCAPGKEQGAKIGDEKIHEIWKIYPLLKKEIIGEGCFGKDYVTLNFRNTSLFDIVGALNSTRGGRRNCGLVDEVRDHDPDLLNEVVLPLMVVERRTLNGTINPKEPQACQFYMTSASSKNSFAYLKLIECLENMIIDPNSAFVFGCDYRLPVKEGILSAKYLQQMRLSPTYREDSFARESLAIWTGGSEDSWFNFSKVSKYRLLVNPEIRSLAKPGDEFFYLISVDVARLSCQTVVTVFKVKPVSSGYLTNVVNIYVLGKTPETKHFEKQAIDLKKIIRSFLPKEVVLDGNGLGVGLLDFMSKEQKDENGEILPAYGVFNDSTYQATQPRDSINIIYLMRASGKNVGLIHGTCFKWIMSGKVKFLVKEQDIKNKLLSTATGRKMSVIDRIKRCLPHEMTTRLFEELSNWRLKGSTNDLILEKINGHMTSDKFSSLEYGLQRIDDLETELLKKRRKPKSGSYVFYSGDE